MNVQYFKATAQTSSDIPLPCFMALNHFCGTLVSSLALFCSDLTRVKTLVSPYPSINCKSVWSLLLISISAATFVCTFAFPVKLFLSQWYVHNESVFRWSTLACHWRARLMPFNTVSSFAKLMCWELFSRCNQHASSITALSSSNDTPIARDLASTHKSISWPVVHHSPFTRSLCFTLGTVSCIIISKEALVSAAS